MNELQEQSLRDNIRQLIEVVKQKRVDEQKSLLAEEDRLRSIVRELIDVELRHLQETTTPDNDPTPNKSTGINVLEDLLKKIIPVLQTDYKLLTTNPEQRESFRAHIINAVIDTLIPAEANNEAGDEGAAVDSLDEEVDIDIEDEGDNEKFIDIRTDAEKSEEEEPADPRDVFGVEGADETGLDGGAADRALVVDGLGSCCCGLVVLGRVAGLDVRGDGLELELAIMVGEDFRVGQSFA